MYSTKKWGNYTFKSVKHVWCKTTEYHCLLWFHDTSLWLERRKTYEGVFEQPLDFSCTLWQLPSHAFSAINTCRGRRLFRRSVITEVLKALGLCVPAIWSTPFKQESLSKQPVNLEPSVKDCATLVRWVAASTCGWPSDHMESMLHYTRFTYYSKYVTVGSPIADECFSRLPKPWNCFPD